MINGMLRELTVFMGYANSMLTYAEKNINLFSKGLSKSFSNCKEYTEDTQNTQEINHSISGVNAVGRA